MTRLEASFVEMQLRLKKTLVVFLTWWKRPTAGRHFDGKSFLPFLKVESPTKIFHHRSYLGATVSSLEPTTLTRKSVVLICRRMTGRKTYDKLANVLLEAFQECKIQGKATKVVTDNGSNFLKVFRYLAPIYQFYLFMFIIVSKYFLLELAQTIWRIGRNGI